MLTITHGALYTDYFVTARIEEARLEIEVLHLEIATTIPTSNILELARVTDLVDKVEMVHTDQSGIGKMIAGVLVDLIETEMVETVEMAETTETIEGEMI